MAKLPKRADINHDFVLRGAVCCADCGAPYRAAWSHGKRKKYAYYVCQTKSCERYGKSIPRDKLEGAFEDLLQRLTTTRSLFALAKDMFREIWDLRIAQADKAKDVLREQLRQAEAQSDTLLGKIIDNDNPRLSAALEGKFNELELSKALLEEKLEQGTVPASRFDEALEHSLAFLANPWKIWEKGQL